MTDYIDFVEEKLELGYDYGAIGGMRFNTSIIKTGDKAEQRNVNWWLPLGRWQLGERTLLESDLENIKELEYLRGFHKDRKGDKQGFRFKDWSDYKADNVIGIGDGNQTQWQLIKIYSVDGQATYRPITKPVEETVKVYFDGIEATGWSVDYSTGILTFNAAPGADISIIAIFEFDIPVWFETDEFSYTLEGYQQDPQTRQAQAIYRLGSLAVQESKIPLTLPYNYLLPLPQKLSNTLDLGIITNTLAKDKFDTSKESLVSGFVRRDSNIEEAEGYLEITKNWNQEELDNLFDFFWNCKGKAVIFTLKLNEEKYLVRFKEDNLNIKFLASDPYSGDSIYAIANLGFFVFSQLASPPSLPSFVASISYVDYNLKFSDDPLPLPTVFTPASSSSPNGTGSGGGGTSGAAGGGAGGSSGGGEGGAAGFGGGAGEVEGAVIPPQLTPLSITEIGGLPVVFGKITANAPYVGDDAYLLLPNLPWDGKFNLVDLGYALTTYSLRWVYHNGACITVLALRPKSEDPASETAFIAILEVFPDFTWNLTNIYNSTGSGIAQNTVRGWMVKNNKIYFKSKLAGANATGNLPVSITPILASSIWSVSDNEIPYKRIANSTYVDGAFEWRTNGTLYRYINNAAVVEFDFESANLPPSASVNAKLRGAIDSNNNTGMILFNIELCDNGIDYEDIASCDGELVNHILFMEQQGLDGELRWFGSRVEPDRFAYNSEISPTELALFNRCLFGRTKIFHLPTGIILDYSDLGVPSPASGLYSAGENYVVTMTNSGGWKIYFINISSR